MAQNTLEIVAKVKADVSEAQKQFQKLFAQFQNFKLDKNTTSDIVKSFTDLDKAFNKLQLAGENIIDGKATVEQLKNIGRASQDVDKAIANLNHNLNRVGEKNFELDLNTPEIIKVQKDIDNLSKALSDKYSDAVAKAKKAQADLANSKYTKKIGGYSEFINSLGAGDLEKAQENFQKLQNNIETAGNNVAGSIKTFEDKIANTVSGKEAQKTALGDFSDKVKQELDKVKADLDNFSSSLAPKISKGDIFSSLIGKLGDDKGLKAFKSQLEEVKATLTNFTPSDAGKLQEQLAKVWETYTNTARPGGISSQAWSGFGRAFQTRIGQGGVFQELINSGTIAQQKVDELKAKLSTFGQEATNLGIASPFTTLIKGLTIDNLDITNFDNTITQKIQSLNSKINDAQTKGSDVENLDKYRKQAEALKVFKDAINDAFGTTVQTQIRDTNKQLGEATNQLNQEKSAQIQGIVANYKNFANAMGDAGQNASSLTGDLQGTTEAIARQKEELGQVVSRFAQFGTMAGILRTFGRVVRSAFASVKELDEAMNSIAVVTDYTTKDLWNQIDAYTAMAQATGSTIKGSYEVAQLYYQQGLTDAEVMTAANETLKMARISNIEYSKATDYATAAIKGFGLAYQDLAHINDVYSNLAAKTAADTEEISIAMSKVASIAHSTGMELETTAAFLTQIIATTREAPETAGTALKTVIARFAEVKKLISQGEVTGTDEEGTEINVNNIEAALKTAGVALRDTTGQMRDLDDVFIELASRWDSLDTMQQRYIATQAAGSRQQSRFLAMMNDYEGLQETLGYAMDSAGASQEQFNKTLDSLQSKLNNLSNAWTEFTTGIMNSDFIKGGVDVLTKILDVINDITGALGSGGSTISKILLTFSTLRYGTGAAGNVLGWLGIPNKLPTIKDQYNTGFFKKVLTNFQGAGMAAKLENTMAKAELQSFQQVRNTITQQLFAAEDAGDILRANELGATLEEMNGQLPIYIRNVNNAGNMTKTFWANLSGIGKASVVIAGITAVIAIIQLLAKWIKTTKERAEEFQKQLGSLTSARKELNDMALTLSNLMSYKERVKDNDGKVIFSDFATLIAGVDQYGQNISLNDEDYNRYLDICNDIIALNPDLAKGYKSNVEAITAQSAALDELIEKQKEELRITALKASVKFSSEEGYQNAIANYITQRDAYNKAKADLESVKNTGSVLGYELGQVNWGFTNPYSPALTPSTLSPTLAKLLEAGSSNNYAGLTQALQTNWKTIQDEIQTSDFFGDIDRNTYDNWVLGIESEFNELDLKMREANDTIELTEKAFEESKIALHDQYINLAMASEGWYDLSDAQQKVVENTIKNSGKFDITDEILDPKAYASKRADIENQIRALAELNKNTYTETYDTGWGKMTIKQVIESLQSDQYAKLGYDQGKEYIENFYNAIISLAGNNTNLQTLILQALGFNDITWEDFIKLGVGNFGTKMYGDKANGDLTPYKKLQSRFNAKVSDYTSNPEVGGAGVSLFTGLSPELLDFVTKDPDLLQELAKKYGEGLISTTEEFTQAVQEAYGEAVKSNIYLANRQDNLEWGREQEGYEQWAVQQATTGGQPGQTVNVNGVAQEYGTLDDEGAKSLEDLSDATLQLTRNAWEAIEAQESLQDAVSDNIKTYRDAKSSGKTYAKEIGAMTKAAQEMFGTYIDADFVEENIDVFDDYANGVEGAEEQLRKLAGAKYLQSIGANGDSPISEATDQALTYNDVLAKLNGANIAVGATFDASNLLGGIQMSEEAAQRLATFLASQKWIVTWTKGELVDPDLGLYNWKADVIKVGNMGNTTPSGGGGGGGGKEPAKPKQDPFYNYIKTADDYKKRLESLQDVQELLTKPVDIFNNTKAQEDYYKTLLGSNQSYLNHVNSELERLQKEAQSKYSKYIEVSIDGSLRLTEEYWASTGDITEELDEWIDAYDDVLGRQKDLTDEINDYKKELKELWEGWRDSFIDLTNDIADVFQELDEKQLEDRQEFYEKLEEQDQRYLESVRNNIEEERKARERANSFEDLQKKQNRLALLQRDSSGRYVNDIAELQEEINSDQQDLADQNVDNILDTLEKQMDKDAERHQDILDAMQKQIDSNVENRIYIERAEQTIAQGEQAILDAIHMGEDWRNASNAEREKMDEEQATNIAGSKSYLEKLNEGITSSSEYISKMVTDALTKQTESLVWTIGDIPQNDEAHVAHAMETTLPSILEQFFARTNTAQDMADDNATNKAKKYATGGLVNYTGPAWVDGTPGKPEAFLNANQTAMIASFTANLAKMISGKFPSSNVEAGSNCEINIDIGSIGADYDIDQAINKVKQEIVNSAQFRNVTLLNRRR